MARKPETPAPTGDYVMALYRMREQEGAEVELRSRIVESRILCDMTRPANIPEQYKAITREVRTPFVRDTWLRVTAALTEKPPVAHVEPIDDKSETQRSANIAERWTTASIDAMNEALGEDVIYESVKQLVRDEQSVVKVVHRADAWANFPRRVKGENAGDYQGRAETYKRGVPLPFAWKTVDRLCMLFGDGEYGDDWALEYGEYPTPYLGNRYRMTTSDGRLVNPAYLLGGKPVPEGYLSTASGRSIKMEYWDAEWWHVVVDGSDAPGFPKVNPYGRLPYFRAKVYEPVLMALRWLVPALDDLLTMKMNWAFLGAYPNPVLKPVGQQQLPDLGGLPGGEEALPPAFRWTPGKMIMPPPGYDFGFVSPPPVGEDLNQLIVILRGLIDVAGVPSVFRGIGGSDQAGYAINQLIAAANLTYKILSKIAQAQIQSAAAFLWHLVRHTVRQAVYALKMGDPNLDTGKPKGRGEWLGLKPDGSLAGQVAPITHLAKLIYTFRPVLPTDEQARAMIAMQLTNAERPLLDVRTAIEQYLQKEDPEAIIDAMKVERYLEEPAIKDKILEAAMRKARLLPAPVPNPASQLVRPDGSPLIPPEVATPPGQMAQGLPAIPGLTQPFVPPMPGAPPITPGIGVGVGGRAAGSYPGIPGGVPLGSRVGV